LFFCSLPGWFSAGSRWPEKVMAAPSFILSLLFAICFTMATWLQPWHQTWAGSRDQSDNLLGVVMGDSRQLFANHFFVKADVYFHSGYYPSIFDQPGRGASHMTAATDKTAGTEENHGGEHTDEAGVLGPPHDWIERFGRHFYPSRHSHLDKPGEAGEILPWLRIAADLDPHKVETYTVAAFWLRQNLGKVDEAEQFLREGWRANPDSYEILFELGRVFDENRHDPQRARNVWELALRKCQERSARDGKQSDFMLEQILTHLAQLNEREGRWEEAISCLERVKAVSPRPEAILHQINELKQRVGSASKAGNSAPQKTGKP
jgi:tetratricopeptide (TPR) repeat protein